MAHNPSTDDARTLHFPPYSPAREIDAATLPGEHDSSELSRARRELTAHVQHSALRRTNHEWQHNGGTGPKRTHGGARIDSSGGQDIHRLRYQYLRTYYQEP